MNPDNLTPARPSRPRGSVCVVVVGRDGDEHLSACLQSLTAHSPADTEIVSVEPATAAVARALVRAAPADVMLVLEPWARSGTGVGTRINYDPHKDSSGGLPRPPHAALFHELVHALYNAGGNQLGREDSSIETAGGRLFELMAVGLPPFDTRPFSENMFRAAWPGGCSPRRAYP